MFPKAPIIAGLKKLSASVNRIIWNFIKKIKQAYFKAKRRYGKPRLEKDLLSCETAVSRRTVASHKKQMGLRSKFSKR